MLGERLEAQLPKVAALQADGVVTVEKVTIVERAWRHWPGPAWTRAAPHRGLDYGALTDLNNLMLLCRYHRTHFLQKGWSCRINADGLPEWIPPRWVDHDQPPQINGASDASTPNVRSTAVPGGEDH
jgi:hypothetical protein